MHRSTALFALAALTFIFSLHGADRPNILWLTSEDNSPFIGCYGDKIANTPNIDRLSAKGITFDQAYSNAAVCAPARTTLILGMYPTSLGGEHMRSETPIPLFAKFYTQYLKEVGYYCTNNSKTDYNLDGKLAGWAESSGKAHYKNRPEGAPFFAIFNDTTTHESRLHPSRHTIPLGADPERVRVPKYLPDTPTTRNRIATYYNRIEEMDKHVGEHLRELEEAGLADDTIVFYYSDHGGVMPRSKRFLYDSGTRVPLVVHFPEKWAHLAPQPAGSRTDEPVGFVDFAPTLLSLAGIEVPKHMQGQALFGKQRKPKREYAYLFRGRADECLDFKRGVTDGRFRYIRNYYPYLPSGQFLTYLWDNPAMAEWHELFKAGKTNAAQSAFFLPAPPEELFDTQADPDEVVNLADDPAHKETLLRFRKENQKQIIRTMDTGFLPEAYMVHMSRMGGTTPYDLVRNKEIYPLQKIIEVADALVSDPESAKVTIAKALRSDNPVIQYWGLVHCLTLGADAEPFEKRVKRLANASPVPAVQIAALEHLSRLGKMDPRPALMAVMNLDPNPMARLQAANVLKGIYQDYPADETELKASRDHWKGAAGSWIKRYEDYPNRVITSMFP